MSPPTGLGNLQTGRRGGVGRRMKSVGYDARSPPRIIRASNLLGYNYVQISPVFPARDRFSIFDSGSTRPRDGRVRPHGEIALQIVDARSPSTHRDIGRSIDYGSPATIHQEARVCASTCTSFSVSLPPFAADDRVKGACLPAHVEATYVARFFPPTSWTRFFLDFDVSYSKLQNERSRFWSRGGLKFIKIKSVRWKILSRGLVIYAKDSNEFLWIGGNREYETRDKCIEERDDRLLSEKEERRRVYKREKGK